MQAASELRQEHIDHAEWAPMGTGVQNAVSGRLLAILPYRPNPALAQTILASAPARSRTWIYRLGGGRLIHWTTRAHGEG
jgi:hypothetical protein